MVYVAEQLGLASMGAALISIRRAAGGQKLVGSPIKEKVSVLFGHGWTPLLSAPIVLFA